MNDDAKKDFMSSDPEDDELNSFKSRKPPNRGDPYEISASEIEALISEYEDHITYEDSLVSEKGGHPNYGEGYADLVFISRIFPAYYFHPKVRYTVDIRPNLKRILSDLTDILSSKELETTYLNYQL